jgi:hypothetical protein
MSELADEERRVRRRPKAKPRRRVRRRPKAKPRRRDVHGFEPRPYTRKDESFARRLEAGFGMLRRGGE